MANVYASQRFTVNKKIKVKDSRQKILKIHSHHWQRSKIHVSVSQRFTLMKVKYLRLIFRQIEDSLLTGGAN